MYYINRYLENNLKEILYVLSLAFSRNVNYYKLENIEKIIYFSEKFGLSERIGCKLEKYELPFEYNLKEYFVKKYKENIKRNLLSLALCSKVNQISKELKIPVIFLKGSSLLLEEKIKIGSRNLADVDLLVSGETAEDFYNYLKKNGFNSEYDKNSKSAHLPPLISYLGVLEIHTQIPFLVLKKNKDNLDFKKIKDFEGLKKIIFQGEEYFILSRPLFFAHLIVHSFFQHYYFPDYYNPFNGLKDLQDLDISAKEKEKIFNFINENFLFPVKLEFIESIFALLNFLEKGVQRELDSLNNNSRKILFHLINGCLDSKYIYSIRIKGIKSKYIFQSFYIRNILVFINLISYISKEIFKKKSFYGIINFIKKTIIYLYCRFYVFIKGIRHYKK